MNGVLLVMKALEWLESTPQFVNFIPIYNWYCDFEQKEG